VRNPRGQVAWLRFGERRWRCTEPPRHATEYRVGTRIVNLKGGSASWRWRKLIFVPNKSLHQKSLCGERLSCTAVRMSGSRLAALPATLGEL
jgi:hypothetical protein